MLHRVVYCSAGAIVAPASTSAVPLCAHCRILPACPSDPLLPSHASFLQLADESPVVLNGFGTIINALGQRAKPYLPQICGTIKWRLNNKSAKIRQQVGTAATRWRRALL